jgi:hypothetical protein
MGWFRNEREELSVEFCDRCGCLCDAGCRAAELRERSLVQALRLGVRV